MSDYGGLMNRNKILNGKVKVTAVKSIAAVAVCLTCAYALFGKASFPKYYEVTLNGEVIGAVSSQEDAEIALKDARYQIITEADGMVYMNPELTVTEKKKLFGKRMKAEELEEIMYTALQDNIFSENQKAYTIKINETTINLASKEEVLELLEATKNRFDTNNEFQIQLVEDTSGVFNTLTTDITKPEVSINERAVVFASEDGTPVQTAEEFTLEEGLKDIKFEQEVQVVESYIKENQLTTVQEAYDMVTKEKEKNEIYEVQPGDCISIIAEKTDVPSSKIYELNGEVTDNSILQIGQELVITVPEPELTVLATETLTYEEEYQEGTIYIDNDSWYTTEQVIQQQGTVGYREVTALVNTRNGREVNREIINEKVTTESLPTIIERGTIVPPTYIKPIVGGTLTSYYGQRWGRLHAGVDWGISTGSTVMASCGGKVVSAGWNGGYGYSILLQHSDGKQTRYAHLSKILVSPGQYVEQGEKIGLSGNTGNSTGPHLHFEIIVNGNAMNPLNYLN